MGLELSKKEIDSIIKGVPEPPKKTISKEKRLEIPVLSKNKKIDRKKEETEDYIKQRLNVLEEKEKEVMASHKQLSRDQHRWKKEEKLLRKNVYSLTKKNEFLNTSISLKENELKKTTIQPH